MRKRQHCRIDRVRGSLVYAGVAAVAVLGLVAVGCDDSGTDPERTARLEATGSVDFSCGVNCSYEGEAENRGAGCARTVRGITRLFDGDGTEIARDEWSLESTRRIRVGETFLYEGCCFSVTQVNAARSTETEITWDESRC